MQPPLRIHLLMGPACTGTPPLTTRLEAELKACGQWAAVVPFDGAIKRIMGRMLVGQAEMAREDRFFPDPPPRISLVVDGRLNSREQRLHGLLTLDFGWPIEWVGWRLLTPRASGEITAAAPESLDGLAMASIEEGFSAIVNLNPLVLEDAAAGGVLEDVIDAIFVGIDACCAEVFSQRHRLRLHAYSRLVDFDRLMRDLSERLMPESYTRTVIQDSDPFVWPLLLHLIEATEDLAWMIDNGLLFPRGSGRSSGPIRAPGPSERTLRHRGGWHRYADAGAFERLMEEVRRFVLSDAEHPHQPSQQLQELIDGYGLRPFASAVPQDVR